MDVLASINDDKPDNKEMGTTVSDDPKDGIIPINVPLGGKDVLPPPP